MSTIVVPEQTVPEHVPPELVWDHSLDAFNSELDDPFLAASRLHDGPDVFWARHGFYHEPAWVITRHDLLAEAFRDPEHFSSDKIGLAAMGIDWKLNPLEFDPPEHQSYRKILNPFFTPKEMAALDDKVRNVCATLIGEFEDSGRCEFTRDFGEKFPSYIFLDMMGLPHTMLDDFLAWEREMLHAADPMKRVEGMLSILHYLEGFIAGQREHPGTAIMQGILTARHDEGRPLTEGEVMGMVYLLYVAGLDTVFSTLGWIMRHLTMDQVLQQRLRENPELIPNAVEEFLRAYSVATPTRVVKKDFTFHGVTMKKGELVQIPTYLAGRDPRAFENPHVIDIDRKPRHIAFATGPHTCLGMHLARRELRVVIEEFLSRFNNIRIPEGERYEYHAGGVFGVDRLPLAWD